LFLDLGNGRGLADQSLITDHCEVIGKCLLLITFY
jgi:hypothetical protein